MSAKDIIRKSILESFQAEMSITEIVIALSITFLIALYIYEVYRLCTRNGFYSKDFNKTLVLLALITAAVVLAMQSNLVISLGMVGALSIVRFRNAIKDPMDLVFLFWSISAGIICGAGLYLAAIILSVFVTIALLILEFIPEKKGTMLLVVNSNQTESMKEIYEIVNKYAKNIKIKSRNITKHGLDAVLELKCKNEEEMVSEIAELEHIVSVSLLDHTGEVRV